MAVSNCHQCCQDGQTSATSGNHVSGPTSRRRTSDPGFNVVVKSWSQHRYGGASATRSPGFAVDRRRIPATAGVAGNRRNVLRRNLCGPGDTRGDRSQPNFSSSTGTYRSSQTNVSGRLTGQRHVRVRNHCNPFFSKQLQQDTIRYSRLSDVCHKPQA